MSNYFQHRIVYCLLFTAHCQLKQFIARMSAPFGQIDYVAVRYYLRLMAKAGISGGAQMDGRTLLAAADTLLFW